jgi:uncharacterized membrane protein YebE (DUF533 family)
MYEVPRNTNDVLSTFLSGLLGGNGRKTSRRAQQFVTGESGLLSASTLMAAAGVAWGVYDHLKSSGSGGAGTSISSLLGMDTSSSLPLPAMGASTPPPLPATERAIPVSSLDANVARLILLAISAAGADGELVPQERAMILQHARAAGIESMVETELARPQPLSSITAGVEDETYRQDLYRLAFAIVRADETVNGAERIYLAQLANQLRLSPERVTRLEQDTASAIDATLVGGPKA